MFIFKKIKVLLFLIVILIGCKNQSTQETTRTNFQEDSHYLFEKSSQELKKFEKVLESLYDEALTNQNDVILKVDSLLRDNEIKKDPIHSRIETSISNSLHYLKAEIFFELKDFEQSILELNQFTYLDGDVAIALASNYSKLKHFDKAKSFIDSIGIRYYLYDYVLGNYYENIGDKNGALKIYETIKHDKSIKHYSYYELAVRRIEELQKRAPVLLNEIYFPTRNPKFKYSYSDNEIEK